MYEALYSPTEGGPYGFRCKVRVNAAGGVSKNGAVCNKVVRTQRGIIAHCRLVHNIKQQIVMEDLIKEAKTIDELIKDKRDVEKITTTGKKLQLIRRAEEAGDSGFLYEERRDGK